MQQLPQKHNLRPGDRMGVWTRPSDNSLYLFGFGVYLGEQYFNGDSHPVVRLDDRPQEEYVLHYSHIFYGREDSIKNTCSTFRGHVHNIDINAFLDPSFVPPAEPEGEEGQTNNTSTAQAPRPVTAFDKLHQLGQEVGLERKKLEMYKQAIEQTEEAIQAKLGEMKALKERALSELDALEKGEEIEPLEPMEPEPNRNVAPDGADASAQEAGAVEPNGPSVNSHTCSICSICESHVGPEGCAVCN